MSGFALTLATIVNTILLGIVSRRLLGTPVGWGRTLLVAFLLVVTGSGVLNSVAEALHWVIPDGQYAADLPVMLVGAGLTLLLAWVVAIGLAALVVLEAIVPTGSLPDPIALLRDLPARQRRARRYAAITGIVARRGLSRFARAGGQLSGDRAETRRTAQALRGALADAGVTYVKLGQMLATRPDLIGQEFADELAHLQADVPPEPWERVEPILRDQLAGSATGSAATIEEVFAHVEQAPLAAASVGQVHCATLRDGREVVLKLQRPGAQRQVDADLDILRRIAHFLARRTQWGADLRLPDLVDGFAQSLGEELDYRVEAANVHGIEHSLSAGGGLVTVPAVVDGLSGRRVLVMERVRGVPLSRAGQRLAGLSAQRRVELARALLAIVLDQIVRVGVFHADLHGGNVILRDDDTLVLLDFGSVGRLDRAARDDLARLLLAVQRDDSVSATDALLGLLERPASLDEASFERAIGQIMVRHVGAAGGNGGTAGMFADLFALIVAHRFTVPAPLAAVFRSLAALEGTLVLLDPGFDLVETAKEVGARQLSARLAPAAMRETLETELAQLLPSLRRLPRRVDALARSLERGELSMQLRVFADDRDRGYVTGLLQQVATTIIAAACSLVAVVLLVAPNSPELEDSVPIYPILGATFLLFAFVLAARVLAFAFRRPTGAL